MFRLIMGILLISNLSIFSAAFGMHEITCGLVLRRLAEVAHNKLILNSTQKKYWKLIKNKEFEKAQKLKERTLTKMRTAKAAQRLKFVDGITGPRLVRLRGGIWGVFKPTHPEKGLPRKEEAAFLLSELWGLHLVPFVVTRKLAGINGTLSLYVPRTTVAINLSHESYDGLMGNSSIRIFDYLIGNFDRHSSNLLVYRKGEVKEQIAIDQGNAFRGDESDSLQFLNHFDRKLHPAGRLAPALFNVELYRPSDPLLNKIKSISDQQLRFLLKDFLTGPEIEMLIKRKHHLIETFDQVEKRKGA